MLQSFSFSSNTVGYLLEGTFSMEMANEIHILILEKLKTNDKINLYLEDSNITKFSFGAVINEILFKTEYENRFNKIALVSDRKWLRLCAALENQFLQFTIKSFSVEDRVKAIDWIANMD